MAVGARSVSDSGNLLAYTTDNTGFRDYTLHVKDLATGKLFPETVARASSVAWAADNKTIFYTVTDMAKRPYRLYRHTLGADPSTDVLLYEEKDEMFRVFTGRSRSRAFIFVGRARSRRASGTGFRPTSRRRGCVSSPRERRTTSTTSTTAAISSTSGPTRAAATSASSRRRWPTRGSRTGRR